MDTRTKENINKQNDRLIKVLFRESNERFADIFNNAVLKEEGEILPETLCEYDAEEILTYRKAGIYTSSSRDIIRQGKVRLQNGEIRDMIFGLEAKTEDETGYVIKMMQRDSGTYERQMRSRRKKGKIRLIPVVSCALYLSSGKWTSMRSLKERMDPETVKRLGKVINDHRENFLIPKETDDTMIRRYKTDVRELLLFLKYADDAEMMRRLIEEKEFREIDPEMVRLISINTGSDIPVSERGGKVNMCHALDVLMNEKMTEGHKLGLDEGHRIGLDEGHRIGLDEGHRIGLDEGRKLGEERKTYELLYRGVKLGMLSYEDALRLSGVSEEEYEEGIRKYCMNEDADPADKS